MWDGSGQTRVGVGVRTEDWSVDGRDGGEMGLVQ